MRKARRRPRLKKLGGSGRPPLGAAGELRALIDAAVDAIIVIDDAGRILSFSPAAEEMFGYEAADVVDHTIEMLMPEPYRTNHAGYMRRYRLTGEARIIGIGREVEGLRSDGTTFPIMLSVGEARSSFGRRYVGIIRDMTPQREAEVERHALEARLAHVARFSLMGEMAAGIAHEINQPLSSIENYSQAAQNMLERGDVEGLRSACLGISAQVHRAADVVENIRNFIRKRAVTKESIDLNAVIRDTLALITVDARDAAVAVHTELAADLPRVQGNMVQLQQVLLNLTRNAVDAMRERSGRRPRRIVIATAMTAEHRVQFEVRDTGPGISPTLGDAIFHPFVTTKVDGLGVGLAISRTIVEAHDGQLSYRDNPEGGAILSVSFPIDQENRT
jgi:two-component system sensor kinase FixL